MTLHNPPTLGGGTDGGRRVAPYPHKNGVGPKLLPPSNRTDVEGLGGWDLPSHSDSPNYQPHPNRVDLNHYQEDGGVCVCNSVP